MRRLADWLKSHTQSLVIVSVLLLVVGFVSSINMTEYPMRFEDEGTYVAQAWAMQYWQQLTHYTYWYDHPPVAWAQIAAWTTLTGAFDRYDSSISAGREFMVFVKLVSCVLLYAVARRLGMKRVFAALAVLLFGLSPLANEFGRYVLLDNIAVPWLLGALYFALAPSRHIGSVVGSAVCVAIAMLSKETFLLLLPVVMYALWQRSDKRSRRYSMTLFSGVVVLIGSFYILYAALKNELFEGEGHVSLIGAIIWQLATRQSSGSIFDPMSGAHGLVQLWLSIDPWLVGIGVALIPLVFLTPRIARAPGKPGFVWKGAFFRQLWIPAIALSILVAMILRPGYLPYPYIIAMLPFAALLIAGVVNKLLDVRKEGWRLQAGASIVAIGAALFVEFVAPFWQSKLEMQLVHDGDKSMRKSIAWINENVSRSNRLVVDSGLWADLVQRGFSNPRAVWLYKTETDPEVKGELGGWQGIDYVAVSAPTLDPKNRKHFPTLFKAKDRGTIMASFGEDSEKVVIFKVNHKQRELVSR